MHIKENKKSVIELYNTVLHKGLRKYTGLSHLPPAAADTNLIVQTFRCWYAAINSLVFWKSNFDKNRNALLVDGSLFTGK